MLGRLMNAMSSAVASGSGSSSSPGPGSTQVHYCRWEWCDRHFTSLNDLESHLIQEHLAHEVPADISQTDVKLRADGKYISNELTASALFEPVDSSLMTITSSYTDSSINSSAPQNDFEVDPSPSDPVHEFLTFEQPAPGATTAQTTTPLSTQYIPAGQGTPISHSLPGTHQQRLLASSPAINLKSSPESSGGPPTQPPTPVLPFGAASPQAGSEKNRIAGVRHSWGTGGGH